MKWVLLRCALLGLAMWCGPASAELARDEAYVIDRLLIGVHKDKDMESEIVDVLPTGTKVEVLQREEGVAQIRVPEGLSGWVDAGYLMQEKPAAQVAEDLEGRNNALEAEVAALKDEIREIKGQQARESAGGKGGERAAPTQQSISNPDHELMEALAEERRKVEALEAELAGLLAAVPAPADAEAGSLPAEGGSARLASLSPITFVMAAALILTIGFAAGVYVADFLQRRRHGGFRV